MSERDTDGVRESAAQYGAGKDPKRDPKTGRFVSGSERESRKLSLDDAIRSTSKRYNRALKKLAE